ncbi:hypothetical protein O5O45_07495 [Hahella aquimaris]|uniref:hypothetical protein n=1 Tax=Hahella sp. HNIBRBA332 TaxID=3015983 RepID=UPI00273C48C9|nr:hypothetical protein [Hahella sp. HNIBRBA332]WLQ15756.1 hypothetical protein O5O45_07495 [Hahella sp. HNIBRBA332]
MNRNNWRAAIAAAILPPFLSGCLEKQTLVAIPDAENILFTSDGQLLVTGGKGIYRIDARTDANGEIAYLSTELSPLELDSCNYTGMAQHGDWVLTSCVETRWLLIRNNHLLAANLSHPDYRFEFVTRRDDTQDPFDALAIPNGVAFAPDGALLVADENFFATSGLTRITLVFPEADSAGSPQITGFQRDWIAGERGLGSPNGVRVVGDQLFISDGDSVKRFQFDANGAIPALVIDRNGDYQTSLGVTLWREPGAIVDDIMPYCGGVALTSFLSGRLHYVASYTDPATGREYFPELYATPWFAFENPSALAIGQGPLFGGEDLLITEKGLLFEGKSSYGNKLTRSPLTLNLDDPDACQLIQEEARDKLIRQGLISDS